MTRKEAATILECMAIDITGALAVMAKANPMADVLKRRLESIDTAQAALREQEERKPCKWCEDLDLVYDIVCYLPHDNGSATDIPIKFCPMCGRRLEEV